MGSLYRLKQKFVDFCNTTNQIEDSTLTVPTSHVVYELSKHLDILEFTLASEATGAQFVEAVRVKMQTLGITSFVGEMSASNGTRYQGYAVFNSTYTEGVVVRTAYANRFMIKYRLQNGTWLADNYFSAPVLLWTNSNPTADFTSQSISTGATYSYYIVTFKGHKSYADTDQFIIRCAPTSWQNALWADLETARKIWSRNFSVASSGIVTFGAGIDLNVVNNTFATSNDRMIPLHIYGCDSVG